MTHETFSFRDVLDALPESVVVIDRNRRVTHLNRTALALLGDRVSPLIDAPCHEVLHGLHGPCGEDGVDCRFEEVLVTGRCASCRHQHLAEEGTSQRRVEVTLMPLVDDRGEVSHVVTTSRDVSDRVHAEEALRVREDMLRTIVEHSTNMFYSHDTNHVLTYVSPQVRQILDCEPEEAMIRWTEFATDNPDNEKGTLSTQRAIDTGEAQPPYELELRSATGRRARVEVREAPVVHDGETVAVVGALTDITDRWRAEEALRARERRYRQLVERNVAGMYRSTLDGRLLDCNTAFATIFGFSSLEEARDAGTLDLYESEDDRDHLLGEMKRSGWVSAWEQTMRRVDGQQVDVILSGALLEDESGERALIEGSVIDITRRRSLERQLRQSQRLEAVGQLAGGVAHDFNNLLQAMGMQVDLAHMDIPPDETITRRLSEIEKGIERAANLTRQLLAFARRQVLTLDEVELDEVVASLLKMLRRVLPANIQMDFRPGSAATAVRADVGQLEQVLVNLVINSRDAMPEGGTCRISTTTAILDERFCRNHPWAEVGRYVVLRITDTGVGMDESLQQRIFEPFFTTKEESGGSGLGLATVYGIVRQHRGGLIVSSSPGNGAEFRVYLPAADVESTRNDRLEHIDESRGGDETILVAEDDPAVLEVASAVLRQAGYTVLTATDGQAAVGQFRRHADEVSLVILDVVMPNLGGRDAYERVIRVRPDVPILFSSGYSENAIHTRFVLDQGLHLLRKPYRAEDLMRAVRNLLDAS